MIKGVRTSATSAASCGTTFGYNLLTIPTGKTFVLTDLSVVGTYADDTPYSPASHDNFRLYDFIGSGLTDASGLGTLRLCVNLNGIDNTTTQTTDTKAAMISSGIVLHLTNGPEFSTGVTPQLGGANAQAIGTGGVWVAGYTR
jgi:hypothetical protein